MDTQFLLHVLNQWVVANLEDFAYCSMREVKFLNAILIGVAEVIAQPLDVIANFQFHEFVVIHGGIHLSY